MAFGPMMKLTTDRGLSVELAPFARDNLAVFVEGFARGTVTQYLSAHRAQTIETEQAWYDEMIKDKTKLVWGYLGCRWRQAPADRQHSAYRNN